MPDGLSLAVAFGGGVVSFLSPCVLPIVPGYLTVITGLDVTAPAQADRGRSLRIARHTGLFAARCRGRTTCARASPTTSASAAGDPTGGGPVVHGAFGDHSRPFGKWLR